jgi:hypothetical protein
MTPAEQIALHEIQKTFPPEMVELVGEFEKLLADVPPADLDREINNLGVILRETLTKTAPQMSEPMTYALPYGFIELLRNRLKAN